MSVSAAYVLIEVTAGNVLKVFRELENVENVQYCHAITGHYDLIVYITAEDIQRLGKVTLNRIQKIPGVLRTITCNVIDIEE